MLLAAMYIAASQERAWAKYELIPGKGARGQWIMHFYEHPEPERLAEVFRELMPISEKEAPNLMIFFGYALKRHPKYIPEFYEMVLGAGDNASVNCGMKALWLSGAPEAKRLFEDAAKRTKFPELRRYLEKLAGEAAPDIYRIPIKGPDVLDALWASFFATGDAMPVRRLLSLFPKIANPTKKGQIVVKAAVWSMQANVREHPRVKEIFKTMQPVEIKGDLDFSGN